MFTSLQSFTILFAFFLDQLLYVYAIDIIKYCLLCFPKGPSQLLHPRAPAHTVSVGGDHLPEAWTHSGALSLSLPLSPFLSFSIFLSLYPSISLFLSPFLPPPFLSFSISLFLYPSISLYVTLSIHKTINLTFFLFFTQLSTFPLLSHFSSLFIF